MGQRWAETRIWLKARSYNHYYNRTCSVRQVLFRVRAGHSYEPAGTLRAAGRQPPYIKGRPGSGLRATTISSRAGKSCLAPGDRNPNQYHLKLDVGFYLHRKGTNQYKPSCSLSRITPSSFLVAMAPRLSPSLRTSAVTIPRQLAPTVGLAHGGVEFLNGSL